MRLLIFEDLSDGEKKSQGRDSGHPKGLVLRPLRRLLALRQLRQGGAGPDEGVPALRFAAESDPRRRRPRAG